MKKALLVVGIILVIALLTLPAAVANYHLHRLGRMMAAATVITVLLTAGGLVQRLQVMPIRSYLSQVERTLTFGLGEAGRVDSLKVIWPDGSEQDVGGVEVDRLRVVEQTS